MSIRKTTDSFSTLDNIAYQVTDDDAYTDANLRLTLFIFISYLDITSYVFDTGANCIILNGVRGFKFFHPCTGNIKFIGGSNVPSL